MNRWVTVNLRNHGGNYEFWSFWRVREASCFDNQPMLAMNVRHATSIAKRADATPSDLAAAIGASTTVDRLLAKHANASADLLEKLSLSGDKTTRKYVAVHPNAPKTVLLTLATQFPGDFYKNPAFDWLLLEEPDLLFKLGHGVLKNILKRPDCPMSFQAWAVERGDEQQKLAVAMNAEAPQDLLRRLAAQGGSVGDAAAGHEKLCAAADLTHAETAFLDCVGQSLSRLSSTDAKALWRRGCIGPAQWLRLSQDVRMKVPGRDGPTDSVWKFEADFDFEINACYDKLEKKRVLVALMQGTPSQIFSMLATDPSARVRRAVAEHRVTPPSLLEVLALDTDAFVRMEVARNRSTPPVVLRALAADADMRTKCNAVMNPAAAVPVGLLVSLSTDNDTHMRAAVGWNLATPPAILEALGRDTDSLVRRAVAANLSTPLSTLSVLARAPEIEVREAVAKNSVASAELLQILSCDEEQTRHRGPTVRVAVASNSSAPTELLQQLALDETRCLFGAVVRQAVAANPSTPPSALLGLSADTDKNVLVAVAGNTATPAAALETLVRVKNLRVWAALAKNATTPIAVLQRLARIKDAKVMAGLAANPACPQGLVQLSAALRWRHDLIKIAKTLPDGAADRLPELPQDESLIEMFRLECQRVESAPHQSMIAELIGADEGHLLTLPPAHSRSAARSSNDAVRLCGLRHRRADPLVLVKTHQSTDWRERLAIAGNPAASLSVLQALSKDAHRLVAVQARATQAVKADEATSHAALLAAAPSRPDCSPLAEEICKRLRQMDVVLISEPWWGRLRIAQRNGDFGWDSFAWLGQEREIPLGSQDQLRLVQALAADPQATLPWTFLEVPSPVSTAALEFLSKDSREAVRRQVAEYEHASAAVLKLLAKDKSSNVRQSVAGNPSTPPDSLQSLARLANEYIKCEVAGNTSTPLSALEKLATDTDCDVCLAVAKNSAAPIALRVTILERLGLSADHEVVDQVAENSVTPAATRTALLQQMSMDENMRARRHAACNPKTPPATLDALCRDREVFVRGTAASNVSTPATALARLALDAEESVREAVAKNPSTPEDGFAVLVKDTSEKVLSHIANNLAASTSLREAALQSLARSKDESTRREAASHVLTPVASLAALADDEDLRVVLNVAGNPSTPATSRALALERLPSFRGPTGSLAAAGSKATPLVVLNQLASHRDKNVLAVLARNASAPLALRTSLTQALCLDADPDIRREAAWNELTPPNLLLDLAIKDFWVVRLAAIYNPAFPSDQRATALAALSEEVRAALEPLSSFAPDDLSLQDFAAPLAVLGLMPDSDDRDAITKAAKSKDWVQRAAACMCETITPSALNRLLDDEVDMVRQLAIGRLRESEVKSVK